MPELPEVETIARDLRAHHLVGKKIKQAFVFWPKTIAHSDPDSFCRQMKGRTITQVDRYGKFLILRLENELFLLIHLRMTGRLEVKMSASSRDSHEHVILRFENGEDLRFRDTRKFGRIYLVNDPHKIIGKLGPDPVKHKLTVALFGRLIAGKKKRLKAMLLDQTFLAGLGNIYVDEALWDARLHPETRSDRLNAPQIKRLQRAVVKVLNKGIKNLGTSIGQSRVNFYSLGGKWGRNQNSLKVFRKTGKPCPRCHKTIRRIIVAQRSTHICPECQKPFA